MTPQTLFGDAVHRGELVAAMRLAPEVDVNAPCEPSGRTPLMLAIEGERVALLEWLLSIGADPNGARGGVTPIAYAAGYWVDTMQLTRGTAPGLAIAMARMVDALLAAGARPDMADADVATLMRRFRRSSLDSV